MSGNTPKPPKGSKLTIRQVIPFLRSVVLNREPLTTTDVEDIEMTLRPWLDAHDLEVRDMQAAADELADK